MMKMRQLLAAALVLAALAAVLYWSNHRKPAEDAAAAASGAPKILSLKLDDITKLEINKRGGDDVVLTRLAPGSWKITSPKPLIADLDAVSTILSVVSPMTSSAVIEEKPSDLKTFGLVDPFLKVSTSEADGKTQTVLFGDDTPTGDSSYAMLSGDPRVFSVPRGSKTSFDKGVKDLRDKRLLPVNFDTIGSVELTGPKLKLTFGSNNGLWTIRDPKDIRGDNEKLETVISELRNASMNPAESDADAKKAETSFASGSPIVNVKVTDATTTYEMQIRKDSNAYYGKSTAMDGAFKLADTLGGAVDKNVEDFRNKKVFDFGSQTPEKVEMHDGPKSYLLTRSGEDWMSDGKRMDPISVSDFLNSIRLLTATKIATSGLSSPILTVIVTSLDDRRVEKVEISKSGDAYVAKREDSSLLYDLNSKAVASMQEAGSVLKPAAEAAPPPNK